jgi:hypothetical protein
VQGCVNNDGYANMLRREAVLGLAEAGIELEDLHITLLQNIAQGCLKLQQNELALIYASAAMRVRDLHGRVPIKAAYRAAVAANKMDLHHAVPFLLAQVRRCCVWCWH